MSAAFALPSLALRFAAAIDLLCRGLTVSLPQHRDRAPLILPAWMRLRRSLARFAALVAALQAGRAPASRGSTASMPPGGSKPRLWPAPARLPCGSGWLLRLAPALETRLGRAEMDSLLAAPELEALLAQAPQAGRILRPLCRALGIGLPPSLRLPPRARSRGRPDTSGGTDRVEGAGGTVPARGVGCRPAGWLTRPASQLRIAAGIGGSARPGAAPSGARRPDRSLTDSGPRRNLSDDAGNARASLPGRFEPPGEPCR